ncbi:MAG: hypothetical protein ACR2MO_01265 [Acidimicrobiales bacterium]
MGAQHGRSAPGRPGGRSAGGGGDAADLIEVSPVAVVFTGAPSPRRRTTAQLGA